MISKTEIPNFKKKFDVVSVFIEHGDEILLLLRQDDKPQGNTWSMPAGKVHAGESLVGALQREIKEEIGLETHETDLIYIELYYVRYPEFDYIYHVYRLIVSEKPELLLDTKENKEYRWVTPKESLKLNLIQDEDSVIKWCYAL